VGVAVVSIMEFSGDADELQSKMNNIDDVARRKAAEYGGVSSTVVRTDDGVMVINMWSDEQGRHKMADDPEMRQAIQDACMSPPSAQRYEALEHRTVID